ncbi:hypothetical protein QVD17_14193 [Tagetes erecta]|uniref:Rapid ALkalinization Factor n=1 Tax=Tagetes erecta TaxID=13708 RepID=A0AAD8KYM2_TARER|nr:hypothetical protein QVD17_14193 [Tagetes erecta]
MLFLPHILKLSVPNQTRLDTKTRPKTFIHRFSTRVIMSKMTNDIVFLIMWALTFSCFAVSSSTNVPFKPNLVVLNHLSNESSQLVRDTIDFDEEMMMESETARRVLAGKRYISYNAMAKNNIPCNQRGQSYYDCNRKGQANPYTRGCNVITRCGGR